MSRRKSLHRRLRGKPATTHESVFGPPARRPDRKALQLCEQVREALIWVLESTVRDDRLAVCRVDAVEPLAGGNRLLVQVAVPQDISADEVNDRLAAAAPFLRAEIAQAITRRNVPELVYLALPGG